MLKIIFLDFDNTLYSHQQHSIPKSATKALSDLQAKGIKVFLSTGRSLVELRKFDLGDFKYDGIVAMNGQIIYDQNNKIIKSKPIQPELKNKIKKVFESKKAPLAIMGLDEIYINYLNPYVIDIFNMISTALPKEKPFNTNKDFYMACMFLDGEDSEKMLDEFKGVANLTYWYEKGVDIIDKDVSKASGIKDVLDMLNLKKEESISFGDGENDLEMMSATGVSVAMGNAVDDIKEKATYVTDSIDDDGLAKALEKYFN